jgi:hypothetical protein
MGFCVEQRNKALGRMYQLGPKAVALNRIVVCQTFLMVQLAWLQYLVEECKRRAPRVVVTRRSWDETHHMVTLEWLELEPGDGPVRDHVEVMVSSMRLVIEWKDKPILVLDVVSPPCPLLTPSASNINSALRGHPLLSESVAAVGELLRTATEHHISRSEFDGASGNDKLHAAVSSHPMFLDDSGTVFEALLCCNHQQHLVSLSILSMLNMEITNLVLASSSFLTANGHWSRLIGGLDHVIEKNLKVTYKPVQEHWYDYAVEICQFILRNERNDLDNQVADDGGVGARRANVALYMFLEEFLKVFNGPWWLGEWWHHCKRDGSCCGPPAATAEERLAISRKRAKQALRNVVLRRKPGKTSINKWSKLSLGFQFFVVGAAPHDMLATICRESLQAVRVTYEKALRKDP